MPVSFALSPRAIAAAAALVALAGAFFWGVASFLGSSIAVAGYLAMMLMIPAFRAGDLRERIVTALWAVLVALAGFWTGSFGLWATVIGLVAVSLAHAALRAWTPTHISRTPVNFVVFAGMAGTGVASTDVLIGSALGCGFVVLVAQFAPMNSRTAVPIPSLRAAAIDGSVMAAGAALIVVGAAWADFSFTSWALLSFCMIMVVEEVDRRGRARERFVATVLGVAVGSAMTMLPAPFPLALAVMCAVLCVAYQLMGSTMLSVAALTPAVLLLSAAEVSTFSRAAGRLEAVGVAALIAVACTALSLWLRRRFDRVEVTA